MLMQLLNSHPQVECKNELLNREPVMKLQLSAANNQTLSNYILARLLPSKLRTLCTGFKLFNEQLEYCNFPLEKLLGDLRSPALIILYRQNLLETYISLKIAFATGIWCSHKEINKCSLEVDWVEFQEYAKTERRRWRKSMLDTGGIKKLFISFEELVDNRDATMRRVLKFLNVTDSEVGVSWSVRQNPLPLAQKVSNYKEIMEKVNDSGLSLTLTADWLKTCCSVQSERASLWPEIKKE